MNYRFNKETLKGLNHLLTRNKDAAKGFVEVANNINSLPLTKWLINSAKDHEANAASLETIIHEGKGNPDVSTSILGELHHAWIDIKAQLVNDDTASLLNECIVGQERAIKDYEDVIALDKMPEIVTQIISVQRDKLQESIKDLAFLKESYDLVEV